MTLAGITGGDRPQMAAPDQQHGRLWPSSQVPGPRQAGPPSMVGAGPIDLSLARAILFGRFTLLTHNRELLLDGKPVPLGSRAIDVLFALVEGRGQLVTKDELLSRVWPTTTVEENCLQFQVSTLRKALGSDRDLIRTVSGRGYRFVGELTAVPHGMRAPLTTVIVGQGSAAVVSFPGPRPRTNLPAPASDLIGREAQIVEAATLISTSRLVTLVGAGGVGKTRLAVEIARRALPACDDGVWIADLGSVSDPGLVMPTIARALEQVLGAIAPERLPTALGSKRMLLVLDNCERVIAAAAVAAEILLHANPCLQVIATSREPLRAEGEKVFPAPPLDVPPKGAQDLGELLQHSATKLFIERAFAVTPGIQFHSGVGAAVTKICRALDGIPLAIELAAASAAALGVECLASRLDDRLSLLTDGRRNAPMRHQTLRATFDWSYALLSESERLVMRRLSLFEGHFTIDEASDVAACGGLPTWEVVPILASLVTKSLVLRDDDRPVQRFRLSETTRAYARDAHLETGEVNCRRDLVDRA